MKNTFKKTISNTFLIVAAPFFMIGAFVLNLTSVVTNMVFTIFSSLATGFLALFGVSLIKLREKQKLNKFLKSKKDTLDFKNQKFISKQKEFDRSKTLKNFKEMKKSWSNLDMYYNEILNKIGKENEESLLKIGAKSEHFYENIKSSPIKKYEDTNHLITIQKNRVEDYANDIQDIIYHTNGGYVEKMEGLKKIIDSYKEKEDNMSIEKLTPSQIKSYDDIKEDFLKKEKTNTKNNEKKKERPRKR